jgi:hypothetical protein
MPTFPGGAAGSSSYEMMSGPKVGTGPPLSPRAFVCAWPHAAMCVPHVQVYIIPQNQGEAPLEIRSVAPGQRGSRKGVIAEIPGRAVSSKWARSTLDLSRKVGEKRLPACACFV